MRPGITAHAVVKNEPFVWYSVMSVYDYVDRILLYDTGSDDEFTLQDIQALLKYDEEHGKKITFKQLSLDWDETKWDFDNLRHMMLKGRTLKNTVCSVRKQQILDTDTEFFLILDGDEVHYREGIKAIAERIVPNWKKGMVGGYIPIRWFSSLSSTHFVAGGFDTCRIFRTEETWLNDVSPGEMHVEKATKRVLKRGHPATQVFPHLPPFAHFEVFLKPWRRKPVDVMMFPGDLPEVMKENPYFVDRLRARSSFCESQATKVVTGNIQTRELKKNYLSEFARVASTCHSVLEIGCGEGNFLKKVNAPTRVGIDAFRPVLQASKAPGILCIEYDLRKKLTDLFLTDGIDCVVGIDVIEHLEKERAVELVRECEQVARNYVMFFVPVGNHPQDKDDRGHGNDFFQTHRSSWEADDMRELGYEVLYIPNYHDQPGKDSGAMWCFKAMRPGLRHKVRWG